LEQNHAVPLKEARIGSMVKFQGFVQMLDLRFMRNIWEHAAAMAEDASREKASALPKSVHVGRNRRQESRAPRLDPDIAMAIKVLKEVPHSVHMSFLSSEGFLLWSAIQPTNLTLSSEDLAMKHGVTIQGSWTAVGMVDASPGPQEEPWRMNDLLDTVTNAVNQIRALVGRPLDHFGFTPLAVYTPIRGAVADHQNKE